MEEKSGGALQARGNQETREGKWGEYLRTRGCGTKLRTGPIKSSTREGYTKQETFLRKGIKKPSVSSRVSGVHSDTAPFPGVRDVPTRSRWCESLRSTTPSTSVTSVCSADIPVGHSCLRCRRHSCLTFLSADFDQYTFVRAKAESKQAAIRQTGMSALR